MKMNKRSSDGDIQMNMTPIIDVVFNLVIFFMLATDMTQKELEDLVLPKSRMAAEDKGQEKGRIIVNLDREGKIKVKRQEMDLPKLTNYLMGMAALERDKKYPEYSGKPILIRADFATEFRYVQEVMARCADKFVRIYKVQLAASRDKREDE
jgi:biopolymer transport protein ExbD